jgi:hypothetical protein
MKRQGKAGNKTRPRAKRQLHLSCPKSAEACSCKKHKTSQTGRGSEGRPPQVGISEAGGNPGAVPGPTPPTALHTATLIVAA